jgi:hypothetical protein
MAYTAWSVVFGEQPTAAKWNQLGANDAGFKDGTNIDAGAIITAKLADSAVTGVKIANYKNLRQNDTTNSTETAAVIQSGWGRMTAAGGSAYAIETVTFPQAYTSIPLVIACAGGDRSAAQGAGNYGQGGNNVHGQIFGSAIEPSTTNFKVKVGTSAGAGTYSAGDTIYYQWIAIGV